MYCKFTCTITRPAPIFKWPTSELPIKPSGNPTCWPWASISVPFVCTSRSITGVLAAKIAFPLKLKIYVKKVFLLKPGLIMLKTVFTYINWFFHRYISCIKNVSLPCDSFVIPQPSITIKHTGCFTLAIADEVMNFANPKPILTAPFRNKKVSAHNKSRRPRLDSMKFVDECTLE